MENAALLTKLLAAPDDDAPRLDYARWLAAQGDDERSEFIEVQCALARSERDFARADRQLVLREAHLRSRNKAVWTDHVSPWARRAWLHRGFVEQVWLDARGFGESVRALRALCPLRRVHLVTPRDRPATCFEDVATSGAAGRVDELDLSDVAIDDAAVSTLLAAGSPVLDVRALTMSLRCLGSEGWARLAWAPFTALKRLELTGSRLHLLRDARPDAGNLHRRLRTWLRSPQLRGLRELDVAWEPARAVLAMLTEDQCAVRLERLSLGCGLTDAEMAALVGSPTVSGLRTLVTGPGELGRPGFDALANATFLSNLLKLVVRYNPTHDGDRPSAASPLLRSARVASLRHLDLSGVPLGPDDVEALIANPTLAGLQRLVLAGCKLPRERQRALRDRFGPGCCTFADAPSRL